MEKRSYNITGNYVLKKGPFRCEICGKEYKNLRSLEAHLRLTHFGQDIIKFEDYYNKYLKNETEGKCIVCGKLTRQRKFKYDLCCSETCAAKYSVSHRNGWNLK